MSQVADAFAAAGLQATVVGLLNSAMQVGQLLSTLGWGLVVEGVGLRASFGAAALVFAVASLPLVPHLPGCARGVARALRGALRRSVARRREAAGLVGIKELKGLPPADPEAWAGEAVAS
jgi:hypothetical protein|eukprot:Transcript_3873.p5 GENE.Transcript_3873~~Transcript_3873.p5  ORF type:complete len:120 (+),score=47.23 Transcript_3873:1417-1776(+)